MEEFAEIGTGGVNTAGASIPQKVGAESTLGGVVVSGIGDQSWIAQPLPSGGVQAAGTGPHSWIAQPLPSGGAQATGTVHITGSQTMPVIGEAILSGDAQISVNNTRYIRLIEAGEKVFFLQKTKVRVGIVLDVIEDSDDVFYEIRLARMPEWAEGMTDALVLHESRVLPAVETESYPLIQDFFA